MIQLAHGCYTSIKVSPANWNKAGAKVNKDWRIYYRFHDPRYSKEFPEGKFIAVKGMNKYKTLAERREATRILLAEVEHYLINKDYNPITGYIKPAEEPEIIEYKISPQTGLVEALKQAAALLNLDKDSTQKDIRSVLKYFSSAAKDLRLDDKPVNEVTRRHIRLILDRIGQVKGEKWTSNNFNFYRAHLMILYKELTELEAVEINPIRDIAKRKRVEVRKKKDVLTLEQRIEIDNYLRKHNYRFWRLMNIFFHSGARNTEMTKVRYEDVDLKKQEYTCIIKKGKAYRTAVRPIKDIVLHLWEQVMKEAQPGQYLFAKGLIPGNKPIRAEQYTRRWKRWVKKNMGIDTDWYPLKHLNTTETTEIVGSMLAAKQNAHTEAVLKKHYDVNGEQREMEILKKVNNSFVPTSNKMLE